MTPMIMWLITAPTISMIVAPAIRPMTGGAVSPSASDRAQTLDRYQYPVSESSRPMIQADFS